MKHISKNIKNEPKSLKETRSTPGASFDDCNKKTYNAGAIKSQIKKLERLNQNGQYTEYCQATIYMLRKKLQSL